MFYLRVGNIFTSFFGSHAFVSWPISSIKSFTDSQNYALSGDMRLFAEKWEEVGVVTRKYDAACEKGGEQYLKNGLKWMIKFLFHIW